MFLAVHPKYGHFLATIEFSEKIPKTEKELSRESRNKENKIETKVEDKYKTVSINYIIKPQPTEVHNEVHAELILKTYPGIVNKVAGTGGGRSTDNG